MTTLSRAQNEVLRELMECNPEADVAEVNRLMDNRFKANGKGPLLWESLEESVRAFCPFAVDETKSIVFYRDGVWHRNGRNEVSRLVIGLLGEAGTQPNATRITERIEANSREIKGIGPRTHMNFRNGMLDLETLELLPHSPDYASTVQLQINWNPDAKAPKFQAWMDSTIDPDVHQAIKEVIGGAIFPGSPFQVAVAMIGPGGNGKGTIERTIRKMLPEDAVSAVDAAELATNRFAVADLYGVTTNLCGDMQRLDIHSTAIFKKATGDDVIRAERKFGQPFKFTSKAFLVFSGNAMPRSTDRSEGWIRRWHIIPMERTISGPLDGSIEATFQTTEELEGIARLAVEALIGALRNRGYSKPAACQLAKSAYRRECNSVEAFIYDALDISNLKSRDKPFTSKKSLSSAYEKYCKQEGCEILSPQQLYRALVLAGNHSVKNRSGTCISGGGPGRGFEGVRIRPEWVTPPSQ